MKRFIEACVLLMNELCQAPMLFCPCGPFEKHFSSFRVSVVAMLPVDQCMCVQSFCAIWCKMVKVKFSSLFY